MKSVKRKTKPRQSRAHEEAVAITVGAIRGHLNTIERALFLLLTEQAGRSTSGTECHNLAIAARAASDVRGLLEIGEVG